MGYSMSRKASQKKWCLPEPGGQIGSVKKEVTQWQKEQHIYNKV